VFRHIGKLRSTCVLQVAYSHFSLSNFSFKSKTRLFLLEHVLGVLREKNYTFIAALRSSEGPITFGGLVYLAQFVSKYPNSIILDTSQSICAKTKHLVVSRCSGRLRCSEVVTHGENMHVAARCTLGVFEGRVPNEKDEKSRSWPGLLRTWPR